MLRHQVKLATDWPICKTHISGSTNHGSNVYKLSPVDFGQLANRHSVNLLQYGIKFAFCTIIVKHVNDFTA